MRVRALKTTISGLFSVFVAILSVAAAPDSNPTGVVPAVNAKAFGEHKATVLFFLFIDCPIANNYAPEMEKIFEAYRAKGVAFYRVYPSEGLDEATANKHAKDYSLGFPAVLDADLGLVALSGARTTPTAVVYDGSGKRRYRGRIDDRYVDLGKYRAKATTTDLRDALDAVLAGKEVANPETKAVGCFLPEPPAAAETNTSSKGASEK